MTHREPRFQSLDTSQFSDGTIPVFDESGNAFRPAGGLDGSTLRLGQILTGDQLPANSLGYEGDFYLHTPSGNYYKKTSAMWVLSGNLKGPSGDALGSVGTIRHREHFISSIQGTVFNSTGRFNPNGSDIGSASSFNQNPSSGGHGKGVLGLSMNPNSVEGTLSAIWTDACWYTGSGAMSFEVRCSLTDLYSDSAKYVARFGLTNNTTLNSQPTQSYGWFEYNGATSPNWLCCTCHDATKTAVDTGIPVVAGSDGGVITNYGTLRIETAADGTATRFKINGNQVALIGTNLPEASFYKRQSLAASLHSDGVTQYLTWVLDYVDMSWDDSPDQLPET